MGGKSKKTISLICIVFDLIFNLIGYEYDWLLEHQRKKKESYSYTLYV